MAKTRKKLGIVKKETIDKDFDGIYDRFREIIDKNGYKGELEFIVDREIVNIYINLIE
jgi:hypothetical protein